MMRSFLFSDGLLRAALGGLALGLLVAGGMAWSSEGSNLKAVDQSADLSILALPAVEGSDQAQVAVSWSGELPVRLQVGYDDGRGGIDPLVPVVTLDQRMTLLPHPAPNTGKSMVWAVLDDQGRQVAALRGNGTEFGWQPGFAGLGPDGTQVASVRDAIFFDGDLVIAGNFLAVGDVQANRVARWDGRTWSTLGSGLNGQVLALAVQNGDLIVGGSFTSAGGVPANRVARWDGSEWTALGSGFSNGVVATLITDGEDLIAGGSFTDSGGQSINRIARWDGSAWQPLGEGFNDTVFALEVYGEALIAGGSFTQSGSVPLSRIARWEANEWQPLGLGLDGTVRALTVFNADLAAGGNFTTAGGSEANHVARWNGSNWSAYGEGFSNSTSPTTVRALWVDEGTLMAAGQFTHSGTELVNHFASWNENESAWEPETGLGDNVGAQLNDEAQQPRVEAVVSVPGLSQRNRPQTFVGGVFSSFGGIGAVNLAVRDVGDWVSWSPVETPSFRGVDWTASPNVGSVYAFTVYRDELIVGGLFDFAGGVEVNSIARWNGADWAPLSGSGGVGLTFGGRPDAEVRALTVYRDELIVAGNFDEAGGVEVSRIARWNGSEWASMGSGPSNGFFEALISDGEDLIAGGSFTEWGGQSVNRIARWDGSAWQPLGEGFNDTVFALEVYQGALIAGGRFTQSGSVQLNRIARWEANAWQPLGLGLDGIVRALTVFNDDLAAGGDFTTAGGSEANHVARWDGSDWTSLGGGVDGSVDALATDGDELIAAGFFSSADGVTVNRIARWNGEEWLGLEGPDGTGVAAQNIGFGNFALQVFDGAIFFGAEFRTAGGITARNIARWENETWSALIPRHQGLRGKTTPEIINFGVQAFEIYQDELVAAGAFIDAGGVRANSIARWDGRSWRALGSGIGAIGGTSPEIRALVVHGHDLIVGGRFALAGDVEVSNIARWDGSAWQPLGEGFNSAVFALEVYQGALVAGGSFTQSGPVPLSRIARWDGAGAGWQPLGSGVDSAVFALEVYGEDLIAGGLFEASGEIPLNRIGRWDGTDWHALGVGTNGLVRALSVYQDELIVGGDFSTAGGIQTTRIARWGGSGWSSMGAELSASSGQLQVRSLISYGDSLIVGGQFEFVNGVTVNNIVRWDGNEWLPLTTGSNPGITEFRRIGVNALGVYAGDLFAGGNFLLAGGMPSRWIARYGPLYNITVNVSGLLGSGMVLQNNRADDLAVPSNGQFSFPTRLGNGASFEVTVLAQPSDPNQRCSIINGSGRVDGSDVTDIQIRCIRGIFSDRFEAWP